MSINWPLLRRAIEIVDGIPKKHFDLDYTMRGRSSMDKVRTAEQAVSCGSIGCAMGWLGLHPEMQAEGLQTTDMGLTFRGVQCSYASAGHHLFRMDYYEARDLFGITHYNDNGASKKIFRQRVRKFFEHYDQPLNPDY
jgi:hypothetical protein